MRKLPLFLILLVALIAIPSCGLDPETDSWEYYEDWRNANNEWLAEQAARTNPDGTPYFTKAVADFDANAYVLMHFFNDRSLTYKNLIPHYTSTCDVKYHVSLYDGTPVDSSYLMTANGDSIYRFKPSAVITGWTIALMNMHVGDSCEVVIPYAQAYGASSSSDIKPYSNLTFLMKLVDIPYYEK